MLPHHLSRAARAAPLVFVVVLALSGCSQERAPAAYASVADPQHNETAAHLHGEHHPGGDRREAHADHRPRHGGQFHMSSDRAYHLEGVLVEGRQFRLYLYDEYTEPVDATAHVREARVDAVRLDIDGEAWGTPEPLAIRPDASGSYLVAALPEDLVAPVEMVLELRFPERSESDAFGFIFD